MSVRMGGNLNSGGGGGGGITIGNAITGGAPNTVLFENAAGNVAVDATNFGFVDAASGTFSYVQLSVGTNGDQTGTDTINIYGQFDAYNPNSVINGGAGQTANLSIDGLIPGATASSSRGTGLSPANLNSGDYVGAFGAWGYTASAYTPMGLTLGVARGNSAANLGGELQWWTKADGGVLTQWATLNNQGFLGLTGSTAPAAVLHIAGNVSAPAWTTNGIGIRYDAAIFTDTTAATGTTASVYVNALQTPTIAATNTGVIYTNAVGLLVSRPAAGTNVTLTGAWAAAFNGRVTLGISSASALTVGTSLFSFSAFQVDSTNNRIQVGVGTNPSAVVHMAGNQSLASWGTSGIGLRTDAATYTDTSTGVSGTVTLGAINAFGVPVIAASNTGVIYTTAATVYINGAPTAGTNVTLSSSNALYVNGQTRIEGRLVIGVGNNGSGYFDLGGGSISSNAWGLNGLQMRVRSATLNDANSTGTVATVAGIAYQQDTITANNAGVIYTDAAGIYIQGPLIAGTNVTLTNAYSLWVGAGMSRFDGGVSMPDIVTIFTTSATQAARAYNSLSTNTGAAGLVTLTLPTAVAGARYKYYVQNTNGIKVQATGTNTIRLAGTVSAAAGNTTSSTTGSYLTLVAINATEWIAESVVGTWTTT